MRLTDLEPRWAQNVLMNYAGVGQSNFPPPGFVNGVTFLCPHCAALGRRQQRLAVTFTPPFGPTDWVTPGQPIADPKDKVWTRARGETFETLTLTPSINANEPGRIDFENHWHGFITDGEVV